MAESAEAIEPAPEEALARAAETVRAGGRWLAIVTGERGDGKTTWCEALVAAARRQGWSVGGVLCPAVFHMVRSGPRPKVRIDAVDLATGERRVLADPAGPAGSPEGLHWTFRDETVAWADALLAGTGVPDLLVIDELGPLEFRHGRGFVSGLARLDEGRYRAAVVVIRPELLEEAAVRWPEALVVRPPRWR